MGCLGRILWRGQRQYNKPACMSKTVNWINRTATSGEALTGKVVVGRRWRQVAGQQHPRPDGKREARAGVVVGIVDGAETLGIARSARRAGWPHRSRYRRSHECRRRRRSNPRDYGRCGRRHEGRRRGAATHLTSPAMAPCVQSCVVPAISRSSLYVAPAGGIAALTI